MVVFLLSESSSCFTGQTIGIKGSVESLKFKLKK